MLKVARVSHVPQSILSLSSHYEYLQQNGCDITIICSGGEGFEELSKTKVSKVHPIEIKRKIDLVSDIKSVLNLSQYLRENNFDIVHSNTPKAAIVSAIAGAIAKVPIRLHTFTGQRWVTLTGPKKWLLMFIDWVVVNLNTHCFTDSKCQTEYMIESLFLLKEKISWIHKGSFTGVDLNRFAADKLVKEENRPLRISFLGRVVNDKGICELLDAFKLVRERISDCELIIIGPYEKEHDPLPIEYEKRLFNQDGVRAIGHHSTPEEILVNTDVFCLPSYREGFPTVILEAAALKLPTVGTDIYGMRDAIVDKETGLLVEVKNVSALANALISILKDKNLVAKMGIKSFERTKRDFEYKVVGSKLLDIYNELTSSSK